MDRLILHPTAVAQWQALVKDAEGVSAIHLSEEIESYLVFLLMRFMKSPEIAHTVFANEFLAHLEQFGTQRLQTLRDVGDKCLLFSGLFPGRARKRRVRISYFVKLGQSAYFSLSAHHRPETAHLFSELGVQFVALMDILHSMCEIEGSASSLDSLQAEELWTDTKSKHSLRALQQVVRGAVFYPSYLFPWDSKQ